MISQGVYSRVRITGILILAGMLSFAPFTGLHAADEEGPGPNDIVVVVSRQNALSSLSLEQLESLYLGRTQQFPNGQRAVPIDLAEGSGERERFYNEFLNRTSAQVRSYWSRILFTGRGRPPRSVSSSQEVLRLLASDPQAIGYLERRFVNDSVTVVLE